MAETPRQSEAATALALDAAEMSDKVRAMRDFGKLVAIFGGVLVLVGLAIWNGIGAGWFGHLPGDIRIDRGDSVFYFPVVTCIIISIVLTVILSLFRR